MEKNKHFLVGVFGDQDELLHGVEDIRGKGIKIHEVFTPFPVHNLEHALGYQRSRMPVAAFLFGATGTISAILMQTLMSGVDWPMIIGGKPYVSLPDFVPITFEMTVLFAAFGMVGTFMVTQNLKPYKVPRLFDLRGTDDKMIMAIDLAKNPMSEEDIKKILQEAHAEEVFRKDFADDNEEGNFFTYLKDLINNGVTESGRFPR